MSQNSKMDYRSSNLYVVGTGESSSSGSFGGGLNKELFVYSTRAKSWDFIHYGSFTIEDSYIVQSFV